MIVLIRNKLFFLSEYFNFSCNNLTILDMLIYFLFI